VCGKFVEKEEEEERKKKGIAKHEGNNPQVLC
jgi:hypothetical protein